MSEDGEVEAINGGEASAAGVKDIGPRRAVDVVPQLERTERLFHAVAVGASWVALVALGAVGPVPLELVLAFFPDPGRREDAEVVARDADDALPPVVGALEAARELEVDVEGLSQDVGVEAAEDVAVGVSSLRSAQSPVGLPYGFAVGMYFLLRLLLSPRVTT